ncbi:glycosyltransferase [Sphingosinicella soli]|uniref:Glycosyltransferase involved in cell wall biosynthesis n=1 Tax=Sphingosinicella soli TaxID=333708 RepID=A0A7W7B4D9_9SPHN|nr:glycosyltransferase involved in cell wall biosynthesis [Sphingosinicella soli]
MPAAPLGRIALIGNSEPRRCGIATFTTDCRNALAAAFPDLGIDFYAMKGEEARDRYPQDVRVLDDQDRDAYAEAAEMIEESGAQAIWLQHEFGIFGGVAGDFILHLLARTSLPVITTFHTVLEQPDEDQRRVMNALLARSSRIIVMAERGRAILEETYGTAASRISVIPHGVPDREHVDPGLLKPAFGWTDRKVILTFGLLAPDKGIDTMIRAMSGVAARHTDALYIVLGATHPNLLRTEGETYRERLRALTRELDVEQHVTFIDRFVAQDELLDHLQAADIYVTPYLNPAQITSGTLSYAVGLGKPVVSTPYLHATEILDDDHGILVPFRDSEAMAEAVSDLLSNTRTRLGYSTRAYDRGRSMLWSELARKAHALLAASHEEKPARLSPRLVETILTPDPSAVLRMSDATGMLQHGIFAVPDRDHGYCVDDNARALILMHRLPGLDETLRDQWTAVYAAFVQHAWNPARGRFRNFMAYDRSWCEEEGSEDSCGRALWALGVTARESPFSKYREWGLQLFDTTSRAMTLESPRASAFAMLGAVAVLEAVPDHTAARTIAEGSGARLLRILDAARRPDWTWIENVLAYDNARLPEALLVAGRFLKNTAFIETGLAMLRWIVEQQTAPAGHFRAVGSESFGRSYKRPLPFDQQPLEAHATLEACIAAFDVTGDRFWLDAGRSCYQWFLGHNDLGTPLATRADGGCFDGLTPVGVNRNQGAESLLALQLSSCAMIRLSKRAESAAQQHPAEKLSA